MPCHVAAGTLLNCTGVSTSSLDLRAWHLTSIAADAFAGMSLGSVDLSHNELTSLPRALFARMTAPPSVIDLSFNNLAYLPPGVFDALPPNADVQLGSNPATVLGPGCPYVGGNISDHVYCSPCLASGSQLLSCMAFGGTHLDLRAWELTLVSEHALAGMTLSSVDLSSNPLTALPRMMFTGMVQAPSTIDLSHCGLVDLPPAIFAPLPAAAVVSLDGNPASLVQECTFTDSIGSQAYCSACVLQDSVLETCGALNRSRLDLRGWGLTGVHPQALANVSIQELDLSHNVITAVPTHLFTSMVAAPRSVDLSSNGLETLDRDTWAGLRVDSLSVSDNALTHLPRQLFVVMAQPPSSVDFSNNRLAYLPPGMLAPLPAGAQLDAAGNNASLTMACPYVGNSLNGQEYCAPCSMSGSVLSSCTAYVERGDLDLTEWGITTVATSAFVGMNVRAVALGHSTRQLVQLQRYLAAGSTVPAPETLTIESGAFTHAIVTSTITISGATITSLEAKAFDSVRVGGALTFDTCTISGVADGAFAGADVGSFAMTSTVFPGIPAHCFRGLRIGGNMNLQHASITSIDVDGFAGATIAGHLLLRGNPLTNGIAVRAFANIVVLGNVDLSWCHIEAVSAAAFPGAQIHGALLLNDNAISGELGRHHFGSLVIGGDVDLSDNRIVSIAEDAFFATTVGGTLDLSSNSIASIAAFGFRGAIVKGDVDFLQNDLSQVVADSFKSAIIGGDLRLLENPLQALKPGCFDGLFVSGDLFLPDLGTIVL